jgi:hypothetical protein
MMPCALAVLVQRLGSSARALSSSSRFSDFSTSKMPPQQIERFADVGDGGLGFGAHGLSSNEKN